MVAEGETRFICQASHPPQARSGTRTQPLGRLVSARTGHGDFEPYRARLKLHGNQTTCCSCGEEKEPTHFYRCPVAWEAWKGTKRKNINFPVRGREAQIKWMLGHPKGAETFSRFVEETEFFEKICKTY